jgi:hypothetical protein
MGGKMKKIMQIIKKALTMILAVIFFAFAIAMTILLLNFNKYGVTQFDETSLIIMRERVASDNYNKGDLVVVNAKKLTELKVGEEVFAYKVDKDGKVTIDLSKIEAIHTAEKAVTLQNKATYSMEFVIGTSSKIYNSVGTYLSIIESTWGFLFIVLVPSFIIFIYEIYALIVEIKYGKDEEVVVPANS